MADRRNNTDRFYWETAPHVTAMTEHGPVRGLVVDGTQRFLGIPYAAPPVGPLRWRPPVAPVSWRHPRDAFEYGNVCAQINRFCPGLGFSSNTEDCLYLNVYSPEGAAEGANLPVMVWIPGGGLILGGSTGYNPSALVKQGEVVVVSMNYRLNVFGFFSHPAINAEDHEIGNYGLMDQQAALLWIQANIGRFGGDKQNVTIFGESAGGLSVWCQMVSPRSQGLFHKAIVQSGTSHALISTPYTRDLAVTGTNLLRAAGVADQNQTSDALRAVPTSDLLGASFADGKPQLIYEIFHTVDGDVLPAPLLDLYASGRFARIPVINGTNRNEFNWFQACVELETGQPITDAGYEAVLATSFAQLPLDLVGARVPSDRLSDVIARYPRSEFGSASEAVATAIGDSGFIGAGNHRMNRLLRSYVDDVYAYEFDAPNSLTPWPAVSFPYGSCHTKELQYLFPGFGGGGGHAVSFTEADATLSAEMIGFWTSFAHRGTPNSGSSLLPMWNPLDPSRDNAMLLAIPECREIERFGQGHHCDFWDGIAAGEPGAACQLEDA